VPDIFTLMRVCLRRGGAVLLDGITAGVQRGCCTVIIRPSGAGKTSLLRLFNRLDDPTAGRVLLDGVPLSELDVLALRRRVVLVGQQPVLLTGSVTPDPMVSWRRRGKVDHRSDIPVTPPRPGGVVVHTHPAVHSRQGCGCPRRRCGRTVRRHERTCSRSYPAI
jgi:hypothetical protein